MEELGKVIERVRAGEADAFGEVIDRYQDEIRRIVAFALRDFATTEDLVQQTFVNAYLKLDQYDHERDFGVWLRAVARNLVREETRSQGQQSHLRAAYQVHLAKRYAEEGEADEYEERLRRTLEDCRERLGPTAARALSMRYDEALNFGAIAEALGRTVAGARQILQRTRRGLRACIEQRMKRHGSH